MSTVESGHFLLNVVNNAEDISLLLENYNMCLADDVLRNAIQFDERPLVLLGTDKRHNMCKKKLPVIFEKLGKVFDDNLITYVTTNSLKEFADTSLKKLKSGEKPEVPQIAEVAEKPKTATEVKPLKVNTYEAESKRESVNVSEHPVENVEPVEEQEIISSTQNTHHGVCKYGVTKFKVEYISPNVLGLQESITVKVEEEELNNFFSSIKGRVLNSINNDR